jgi:PAS domain S-box-containing protein
MGYTGFSVSLMSLVNALVQLESGEEIVDGLLNGLEDLVGKKNCWSCSLVTLEEMNFHQSDQENGRAGGENNIGRLNKGSNLTNYYFNFQDGNFIHLGVSTALSDNKKSLIQLSVDTISSVLAMKQRVESPNDIDYASEKSNETVRQLQKEIKRRKRYETRLEESEKRNVMILDNSMDAILLTSPSGEIFSANNSACHLFGMTEAEIISRGRSGLVDPGDPRLAEMLERRDKKGNVKGELFFLRKDGSRFEGDLSSSVFLNEHGEPRSSMIIRDVTHQKKIESQLLLLGHSVEQSPLSIVITDLQGEIKYVNKAFTKITGFEKEEALGQTMNIVDSGLQCPQFLDELWQSVLDGNEWTGELKNKRKTGELYWEYIKISPVRQASGEITHVVSIREDITEKKKMIDDLIIAKEKAEESDRLKTAFLANVSHEIRTPMNGILGFMELLKMPGLGDEEKDSYIDMVNSSGDRLLKTINDLIEISKIESGQVCAEYSQVDIREIMNYALRFFTPQAQDKKLGLRISEMPEPPKNLVFTDRTKVEAALSNLIFNAIKFTNCGEVIFGSYMDAENMVFYVKDTGVGIAPDQMDAVFDRFVQADLNMTKPYQGTGLGLSIIRGYITHLKGKIWVESEVGKGSVFYFSIPCRSPQSGMK